MFGGAAIALAAGAYFHGPLQLGETYDRSVADVYRMVESTPLPPLFDKMVYNQRGGTVTRGGEPQKSMVWYFHARGQQIGKYTVTLAESGPDKTRVTTRFEMAENADQVMGKGIAIHGSDQFKVIGRAAMDEQIDARLDKRPYDSAKISEAMAGYIATNMGQVERGVSQSMDQAAEQFRKADAEAAYQHAQAENRRLRSDEPTVK